MQPGACLVGSRVFNAQRPGRPSKPTACRYDSSAWTAGVCGPAGRRTVSPTRTTPALAFPPTRVPLPDPRHPVSQRAASSNASSNADELDETNANHPEHVSADHPTHRTGSDGFDHDRARLLGLEPNEPWGRSGNDGGPSLRATSNRLSERDRALRGLRVPMSACRQEGPGLRSGPSA